LTAQLKTEIYCDNYRVFWPQKPGVLGTIAQQRERNPDVVEAFKEDISDTSIEEKKMDLCLMIDVIEHVPNPAIALKELKRISGFVIFKTPLENNLYCNTRSFLSGAYRQKQVDTIGHVNYFSSKQLNHLLSQNCGKVIYDFYSNCYKNFLTSSDHNRVSIKVFNLAGFIFQLFSPSIAALIFTDYKMSLVNCD